MLLAFQQFITSPLQKKKKQEVVVSARVKKNYSYIINKKTKSLYYIYNRN
jgi:hypothetical protein